MTLVPFRLQSGHFRQLGGAEGCLIRGVTEQHTLVVASHEAEVTGGAVLLEVGGELPKLMVMRDSPCLTGAYRSPRKAMTPGDAIEFREETADMALRYSTLWHGLIGLAIM
jgi:hypothetical protein